MKKAAKTTRAAGVIGLGNMGRGIAENLIKAKVPLLVWDIDAAARRRQANPHPPRKEKA